MKALIKLNICLFVQKDCTKIKLINKEGSLVLVQILKLNVSNIILFKDHLRKHHKIYLNINKH